MLVNIRRERAKAVAQGWDVLDTAVDQVNVSGPLAGRGIVSYVLLPAGWICDTCGERVTVARFTDHARKVH